MAGFVVKSNSPTVALPKELPDATATIKEGYPNGQLYELDNGDKFRLVHPVEAHWEKVTPRVRRANGEATEATATEATEATDSKSDSK